MNKLKLLLGLVILFNMELSAQQSEQDKKMIWWREARFGMFIHWGPYAVWGGLSWIFVTCRWTCMDDEPL